MTDKELLSGMLKKKISENQTIRQKRGQSVNQQITHKECQKKFRKNIQLHQ